MKPQQISAFALVCGTVTSALVCGTVTLAGWGPNRLGDATFEDRWSVRVAKALTADAAPVNALLASVAVPATSYLRLPDPVAHGAAAVGGMATAVAAVSGAWPAANVAKATPASRAAAVASAAMSAADAVAIARESTKPAVAPAATSNADATTVEEAAPVTAYALASASTELPVAEAPLSDPQAASSPENRVKLVSLFRSDPGTAEVKPVPPRLVELVDECLVLSTCIDEYLWALYERTPKIDTNKITERIKVTVKRRGKTRTVTKTITKYVTGDFTWKDPAAAKKVGMSLKEYVIGGMDRSFKLKLFRALRQMDEAGYMPGITSAFRDDYRQAIAVGKKAASDSSFHGGSRRGGYGHGLAVDLV